MYVNDTFFLQHFFSDPPSPQKTKRDIKTKLLTSFDIFHLVIAVFHQNIAFTQGFEIETRIKGSRWKQRITKDLLEGVFCVDMVKKGIKFLLRVKGSWDGKTIYVYVYANQECINIVDLRISSESSGYHQITMEETPSFEYHQHSFWLCVCPHDWRNHFPFKCPICPTYWGTGRNLVFSDQTIWLTQKLEDLCMVSCLQLQVCY